MVHQPSGGYAGTATDIAIHAQQILKVREQLNNIYSVHLAAAGKEMTLDEINKMLERDKFMSAQESLEMGLIDEIMDRRQVIKGDAKSS
jgi:ATP-dependent Clp protease protease subunit